LIIIFKIQKNKANQPKNKKNVFKSCQKMKKDEKVSTLGFVAKSWQNGSSKTLTSVFVRVTALG
jgi:hypothetical protein